MHVMEQNNKYSLCVIKPVVLKLWGAKRWDVGVSEENFTFYKSMCKCLRREQDTLAHACMLA